MSKREYPCDSGSCPYDAELGSICRDMCGMGVDENVVDFAEMEAEDGNE